MNKCDYFICFLCNKEYSSASSICNHNKKFHSEYKMNVNTNVNNVNANVNNVNTNVNSISENNVISCKYCNKTFSSRQSKSLHLKKYCNKKDEIILQEQNNTDIELEKIKLKVIKEDVIRKKEEAKILELKLKLQKSDKVDNITLRKLNKMLLQHNNRIKNSNNNNTNSNNNTTNIQNNNIINNYQIVGFGKEENIHELLTNQEKRMILNSKLCSLEKLIEIVHCGNYNQFKNIIVTNIKDNYMYKYDDKLGLFVLSNKNDVLNSLIDYRMGDLEVIYNDFLEKNKIDEKTKNCIEKFINKINYNDNEGEDGEHENYKQYKINEIKVLLFNNQDKIANDISLLLSAEETNITNNYS